LFPAALGKTGKLSCRSLVRTDAPDMFKRRLKQAGLPHYWPHSFRATGITNFLEMTGTLEAAQRIARPRRQPNQKSFMTAAARRYCSKTWSGLDIKAPPN
jgi:hypothetical protein